MNSLNRSRCPHFQIYTESLIQDGPPSYLAIRRCLLTERLNRLLRQSEDGSLLADKLIVTAANNSQYAFVGPDFEAVTQQTCSITRCETRCTPAYHQHLEMFSLTDPEEDDVTCKEMEESRKELPQEQSEPVNARKAASECQMVCSG